MNIKHESAIERKIHTIRNNYELWEKRFKEINKDNAQISVRYWADKRQITICNLTKADGISLQKIRWDDRGVIIDELPASISELAKNDGLSKGDLADFLSYDKDMALIQFTNFRYEKRNKKDISRMD